MNSQANTTFTTFAARRNNLGAALASVLLSTCLLASVVGGFTQQAETAAHLARAQAADTVAQLAQLAQPAQLPNLAGAPSAGGVLNQRL